ncbi:CinA family nicotinamide mononucleotide deamidase-related protein [Vibrio sp. S4M6]|uniref:CinA family nicotinamide mononucleotide deamidase-related protein n=1 Tax=Vibrio sinus TaxID=2946865 RepID=UPI00202A4699|nr:CinA family nicotinamide mononucleotide deamidase-related protein [Vibrio sinus]MCL9783748.1 CinA family nicotinamide mononucleotide deamidase-related protein [Vibrio sinus]
MIKIAMLSTGEEVLHGDIVDTNASWLSSLFFEHGFSLCKRSTVGDSLSVLAEELLMLSFNNDVVVVNGGLGPTTDDLSAEAAAKAANTTLVPFQAWLDQLDTFFKQRGVPMPKGNTKQAMLPKGSEIIDNPVGTACGFQLKINDCTFFFTPGVPSEFNLMVENQILPRLKEEYPEVQGYHCHKLHTLGASESSLSDILDKIELPDGYYLGYRSYLPYIEVKLFSPRNDEERRAKLLQLIYSNIKDHVVSVDESLIAHLGHLAREKNVSIATSEQSTQGWLTQWLHSDDNMSQSCRHGWVLSEGLVAGEPDQDELAATFAMAGATREKCGSDIALVTGKLKDNQFCIALSTASGEWGRKLEFYRKYALADQKVMIATVVGDMLRRHLSGLPLFSQYSSLKVIKELHLPSSAISES